MSLYQLPNGAWIDPCSVFEIAAFPAYRTPVHGECPQMDRVEITCVLGGGKTTMYKITCASFEDAQGKRDALAGDINTAAADKRPESG